MKAGQVVQNLKPSRSNHEFISEEELQYLKIVEFFRMLSFDFGEPLRQALDKL